MQNPASNNSRSSFIPADRFYRQYHGHSIQDLETLLEHLRTATDCRIIWTAGDSSLDNKYWFPHTAPAVNGYQRILHPPIIKQDVTYWLNYYIQEQHDPSSPASPFIRTAAAINTAVEATTLNERSFQLRAQDVFVRDNLQSNDILLVSVGSNDVALCPSPCTIVSILCLIQCCPTICIQRGCTCSTLPCDDTCWGCGPSFASCACAMPPCLGYLRHLFGRRLQRYMEQLTSKCKPSKIFVCMIYYPDETPDAGWAGPALGALGYNANPAKLQAIIAKTYEQAICRIQIPGTQVIPVPLFRVLDGKTTSDYVQRVEPSPDGGRKMAEYILDLIDRSLSSSPSPSSAAVSFSNNHEASPSTSYMRERG